jgi:hypothetical protein
MLVQMHGTMERRWQEHQLAQKVAALGLVELPLNRLRQVERRRRELDQRSSAAAEAAPQLLLWGSRVPAVEERLVYMEMEVTAPTAAPTIRREALATAATPQPEQMARNTMRHMAQVAAVRGRSLPVLAVTMVPEVAEELIPAAQQAAQASKA